MNTHNLIAVLGLSGLLLTLPALAAVYMEKDAQGNTVFTDRPSSEKAKPIELSPASIYQAPATSSSTKTGSSAPEQNSGAQRYEFITITSPVDDSPVRENSGALEVSVDLSPELKADHHFVLLMDGIPVAEDQGQTLSVQNVDRGTHSIQVQVVDEAGNVLINSESVSFHMLRI